MATKSIQVRYPYIQGVPINMNNGTKIIVVKCCSFSRLYIGIPSSKFFVFDDEKNEYQFSFQTFS